MMMLAQMVVYYYKILKNVVLVQNVQKDTQRLKVRMNVNQNNFVILINMQMLMVRHVSKAVVKMKNGYKSIKMLNYVLVRICAKININKLRMKTNVLKNVNIINIQSII